jgi:hypothetical protein
MGEDTGENATMQANSSRLSASRKRPQFYDKRQQLELALEAQRLLETEEHGVPSESSDEKEECDMGARNSDIWEDSSCMELLQTRVLPITINPPESKRVRKRVLNYHWQGQSLYFRNRLVPKPGDRLGLVVQMHKDLGHSGEERTLTEICRRYFWHD